MVSQKPEKSCYGFKFHDSLREKVLSVLLQKASLSGIICHAASMLYLLPSNLLYTSATLSFSTIPPY